MVSHPDDALERFLDAMRERVVRSLADRSDTDEGLRQRKKRLTRQMISDVATAMFLQRGYHGVRVSEVAEAAGVSEKTVFNYFPTKESLVLDREPAVAEQLRHSMAQGQPVAAAVEVIAADVHRLFDALPSFDAQAAADSFGRFLAMVEGTPELRAAQRDMEERLIQVAAEALATRAGVDPGDPEPQIAATAIVGLWRLEQQSMRRHLENGGDPRRVADAVIKDVRRAARLLDTGLWCFGLLLQGAAEREELRAAYESVEDAVRQIVAAVRQARAARRRRSRQR